AHRAQDDRAIGDRDTRLDDERVGGGFHEIAVETQECGDVAAKCDEPAQYRADVVELQFELGHDTEISTAAAQSPEKIRGFIESGEPSPAVCGDHTCSPQVVARGTVPSKEPSESAAQRQASHANIRVTAEHRAKSVRVGSTIQIARSGTGFDARKPAR